MQVICLEEVIEIQSNEASPRELVEIIHVKLKESDLYLNYLLIDGVQVYDYIAYFNESFEGIQLIEVHAHTFEQMNKETLESAQLYLNNVIPAVLIMADDFYKNPTSDTWSNFEQFLEGLEWLNSMMRIQTNAALNRSNNQEFINTSNLLHSRIEELQEAVNNSDTILIADIIKHEIIVLLQSLKDDIFNLLDRGYNYDSN
jgi:hypothetical protein